NNQILYSFTRTYTGDLVTMTDYTSGTAVNYYYVHNGHGDIIGLKDKTGTTVVTYEYDAFGTIITATGTAKTGNGRLLREENPFRYASYFYDEETKLYYLRMRFYEPKIGRFLTRDIIPDDNMYVYVENNPVRYVDPLGLLAAKNAPKKQTHLNSKSIESLGSSPRFNSQSTTKKSKTKKANKNINTIINTVASAAGGATAALHTYTKYHKIVVPSDELHLGRAVRFVERIEIAPFKELAKKVGYIGTILNVKDIVSTLDDPNLSYTQIALKEFVILGGIGISTLATTGFGAVGFAIGGPVGAALLGGLGGGAISLLVSEGQDWIYEKSGL
ncbi:RHS repeat-associated core domain, partial [Schinkia azotoformans MEV2011]